MSSPTSVDSGDVDAASLYQIMQANGVNTAAMLAPVDANSASISQQQRDTIEPASGVSASSNVGGIGGIGAPSMPAVDPNALAASDANFKKFMDVYIADGGKNIQGYIDQLPPEVQAALYSSNPSPTLDALIGQMQTTGLVSALASIGLQNIPSPQPSGEPEKIHELPPPGKISATASRAVTASQLLSNSAKATENTAKIVAKEAVASAPTSLSGAPNLMAFLKAIGQAIDHLKEFLAEVQKADLKGSMGQRFDAGSDAATLQLHKIQEAQKKARDGSGGILGLISHIAGDIFGPIFKLFGINPFGGTGGLFGGIQDMAKKLLDVDIPVFSGVLKDIAKAFSGVPILSDILNSVANHGLLVIVGAVLAVVLLVVAVVVCCCFPMMGVWGILLVAAAAAIFFVLFMAAVMILSGEPLPIVGNLLSMTNTQLPLVGGVLSMVTGLLDSIPVLGDIIKTFGLDNQWVLLGLVAVVVLAVVICCCCVWAIPFVVLLIGPALIATYLAIVAVTGTKTSIPLVSSLIGQGPTSEAWPASKKATSSSTSASHAAGSSTAANNFASNATKKLVADSTSSDELAALVQQIQKLIALLVAIQSAAQGGTIGPIPMDQILGIINKLSAKGVGGTALKDAQKAGKENDLVGMMNDMNKAFSMYGTNPQQLAALLKQIVDDVSVPDTGETPKNALKA